MDDNRIEIVASLDIPKTVSTIEKDLEEVKKRLDANKALSIVCSLDTNSLATLQNQVSEISKKLKIDIPKIEIQAGTGQSAQNIENVARSVETVTNKVLTLKKTLADLDSRFVEAFKAVENPDGIINAERTMATIQSRLSSLGTVTVTGKYNDQESADSINKIIARIEAASGEVRELNFLLDATGQKFEYIGGSYSDKGVSKIQQDLARLSKELANFEASHKSIESGLIEPLTVARNAIIDLESGVGSVESAQKALDNLKTSAAEIGVNLKSTGSSFNVFDNASNKAKNFDNIIKGLELDINNLNQESNKSNLSNSLDEARQKLQQLQNVESQFGKGVEWSKNYKEVSELLQTIANDLKVVQREEKKAFQDDNRVANLQNRIKRLTADVNAYGEANERATKSMRQMSNGNTFAVEWSRITSQMAKGADLTDRELKDLSADMAVFRKEAQAAGLAGESAFGKFLNSFKTMSSYITANMVFNAAKRQLSQMIEEVKAVDTAMVELRKVTSATEYEFQEFAKSATKTGIELGASVSDVINATATFARLGESLPDAEELGRVATLYKNVGDGIDIETASEDIISTMKAFKIEAKDAIKLVDKFNEVGNSFAISSGGIGEALKRSASALSAANNDISESIALITTANTIAQDPTTVGQGIKTMSLRIRSTKTELEDLGEDAEGAAENVSKLREQMLALTGVDIQLDKNTYKSTYQILLEMSKVWDKLDDMTQASVLEQLFGKRQANIGAAILTNGELLQQVYETSEKASDGIGSAMREQEEYAKSIQYNLDSLKASYQQLAQEIVQSETVVTIIKALNEGLQSLGSSDIVIGINAVSQSLIALTQTALNAKEKIESLPAIGDFASRGLDQVRGVAFLKAAGKIYDWLNKDEKAEEEAARSQEELNVNYEKSLGIYDETSKSLQDLTSEYIKLMASTEDVSSARESLLNLQNSFVDKYGEEAEGLDLVNKSLEDNVRWLIERQKVLDEQFVSENSDKIAQAKERFGVSDLSEGAKYELWDYGIHLDSDEARREAKLYSQEVSKYLKENYSDIFENSIIEGLYEPMIRSGITPAEQVEAAKAIEESYKFAFEKYSSLSNKVIDTNETLSAIGEWRKNLESDLSVLETVAKRIDDIKLTNEFIGDNKTFDKFNELIVDLDKFNDILNSDESTIGEKISASTDIDKVVESLKDIANEYPIVSDLIKTKIESVGLSFDHVTDTFETAKSEWLKSLDEAQKGTLTNVDKIVAAMKKLYSGEAIESKSAWEILNLDDKKLLSDIRIDSNGGYIFDLNQIISLKDEIIKKEIAEREESINTATIKRDAAEKEIAVAKERLEVVSAELAIAKLTKADNVEKLEAEYNKLSAGISATQSAVESYNYTIRNESIYTDELRKKIGSLADTSEIAEARIKALKEEVSALNKEADGLLKAQEHVIDGYIKKEQQELDVLEKESDELNKQLDTLEEQKSKTEEILSNYKTVADVVSSTIDKQIEGIEKERQEIEDFYDKQIEELKSANEEREDALEYEKKLANLANAQNNKVRVYDQARGWIYEADKEALQNAQEDLASFETNQQIKAFEKERDKAVEGYDERIKSLEEYGNLWSDFVSEVTDEQNELLANEILGSDWREKISDKDLSVLNKFKTGYTQYNTQLKNIVDVEIANLKKSIEAKDKDVAAKKDQIQAWQDYKSAIQDTANSIKDGLEEYNKYLDTVQLNEKATNEQRLANLDKFASRYREIVDSIADKNALIESTDASISHLSETAANVNGFSTSTSALGGISGIASIADVGSIIEEVLGAMSKIFGSIFHFAKGGAADYTGLAWVDGTKTSSETVFTAAQSKKLLNLVEALPNLNFSLFNDTALRNGIANNTNSNISIGSMTVVANNPQQFAEQFNREINRYWQTKLTENKVY